MNDLCPNRVYLLHFVPAYRHAKHYLGTCADLAARLREHAHGAGARLTQVQIDAGGTWVLARVWVGGRRKEAALKRYHSGVKLCPICRGEVSLSDLLTEQTTVTQRTPGRRRPMGEGRPVHWKKGG